MKTTSYFQKKLTTTLAAMAILAATYAQFTWDNVYTYGSHGHDYGKCIATDFLNTAYFAGEYGELFLDSNGNPLLPSLAQGCNDIFIFRYDMNGNLMMARNLVNPWSGPGSPYCTDKYVNGMATGEPDGLYITGSFSKGICIFDPLAAVNNDDGTDFYIARIEPNSGHCMWVKTAHQNPSPLFYDAKGTAVAADKFGNAYVTGQFTGHLVFNNVTGIVPSVPPNNVTLTALNQDIFIAKYNLDGNCIWVNQIKGNAGSYFNYAHDITTDKNGNIYVTGSFQSSATFGNILLTSTGVDDIFLAKYDPQGNCLWAINEGGHCHNAGHSVTTDDAGWVFLTGFFQGSDRFGRKTLTSAGAADVFLAKYDPNGKCQNAIRFGNTDDDWGVTVRVRHDRLWLMGAYSQSIKIGPRTLFSAGGTEHFLSEFILGGFNLLDAGNLVKSRTGTVVGEDLELNTQGDVFAAGTYTDAAVMMPFNMPGSYMGTNDVFFSRIAFWNTKGSSDAGERIVADTGSAVAVYPNPASDFIRISVQNKNQEPASIIISDVSGREVFRATSCEAEIRYTFTREELGSPGLYFCTILSNGTAIKVEKIILLE